MPLIAAGLSFRSAPLEVRERVILDEGEARTLLRWLMGHTGLSAAAVLSTCNRTEFYIVSPDDDLAAEVVPRLGRYLDPGGRVGIGGHLVEQRDADAIRHVFRVAAGLESMVVGEPQVLGQLKEAHRLARDAGTLDASLDFVLRRALSTGKRVRTETAIGRRAGGVADVAVSLARERIGDLRGRTALCIGAGEMAELACRRLAELGARLLVTSRGGVSALALAAELGAEPVAAERLVGAAARADLVISSTTSPEPVLDRSTIVAIQETRDHRPLLVVDMAVPRDVDPGAASVDGVDLVDIDELGRHAEHARSRHRQAIDSAAAIVEEELEHTGVVLSQRGAAVPTITELLQRAEEIRLAEVDRTLARLPEADPEMRARLDALTRSLVRKLLHAPIAHLKESSEDPGVALLMREAFDLDTTVTERAPRRRRRAS